MRIDKIKNLLFLGITFSSMLSTMLSSVAMANEKYKTRFILDVLVGTQIGAETYGDWIENFPITKKSKHDLKRWLKSNHLLEEKVDPISYKKENSEISWKSDSDDQMMQFKLVSVKPITFELNGNSDKIEFASPTIDYIYQRLDKMSSKRKVSWMWSHLIPDAHAMKKKTKKKVLIPLFAIGLITFPFVGLDIYQKYERVEEIGKQFDAEVKFIEEPKRKIEQAKAKVDYPYAVSNVDCRTVVGGTEMDIFAKPGAKGSVSYGLKSIRLTPKGDKIGENDIEVTYAMESGKNQIKEIRYLRPPTSGVNANFYENSCPIYAANIKAPQNPFLNNCVQRAFPDQTITSLEDFYALLQPFNLKDHETLGATEPGCFEMMSWLTGGGSSAPANNKDEKTQTKDSNSQTQ